MHMIKVLVADDHPGIGRVFTRMLGGESDMEVVGVLQSADQLSAEAARTGARVVRLDLSMPGREPLSAIADLPAGTRAIVYSGYDEPTHVTAAVNAGAWGFLAKGAGMEQVLNAIRTVAQGERYLPPGF